VETSPLLIGFKFYLELTHEKKRGIAWKKSPWLVVYDSKTGNTEAMAKTYEPESVFATRRASSDSKSEFAIFIVHILTSYSL
jgi:hypothetical protein